MITKETILNSIKGELKRFNELGVSDIGLFGSYTKNTQNSNSDIDILVDFEPGKDNFDNYMAVYDLLENVFINRKIDVVTKNSLSRYIEPAILNEVVYV